MKFSHSSFSILINISVVLILCTFKSLTTAQSIQTDGTTPTQPRSCSGDCTIKDGLQQGGNLFHSFERFNIDAGATVLFEDPGVANILSRVTGNELSEILGTIGVNGGDANLFLLNPNGIIFGQDSNLDLNGSFLATTANAIRFDGEGLLDTAPNNIPLLTINPSALLFTTGNQGTLSNESIALSGQDSAGFEIRGLRVSDGESLLLAGGDVIVNGGMLNALGGRIELGGLAEAGEIKLNFPDIDEGNISLEFSNQFSKANVSITNGAIVSAFSENGGEIAINAKNITIAEESMVVAGIFGNLIPLVRQAGDISLNATEKLEIIKGAVANQVAPDSRGDSGNININTGSLIIDDDSFMTTATFGSGDAGDININVPNGLVKISGETTINSLVDFTAIGSSGDINIIAKSTLLEDNSSIDSSTQAQGNAGGIKVTTEKLNIQTGGEINVSANGTGEAGSLNMTAQDITLDQGSLTAETRVGDRGNITLNNVDTLLLLNNSQITTNASESATGGDITITSDGIALLDSSDITANAFEGRGGNIQITTQGIFREPDSDITAASELGIDGTITINSPEVDPTSGIFELPNVPIDAEGILAQDLCKLEDEKIAKGSSFIITGRGGLTPTSEESLENRDRIVNWASRDDLEVSQNGTVGIRQREKERTDKSYPEIQQSQGLIVASDGSIWLTANVPNTVPQNSQAVHPDCRALESGTTN